MITSLINLIVFRFLEWSVFSSICAEQLNFFFGRISKGVSGKELGWGED